MKYKTIPPPELLHELLRYEDGRIYWKTRATNETCSETKLNAWNKRYAGKEAGTLLRVRGNVYRHFSINKIHYLTHRVVWAMFNKHNPLSEIDHIDGNGQNNHIENLRDVDRSTNKRNSKKYSSNTSGIVGVYYYKRLGTWMSLINYNGGQVYLGYFKTKEEAAIARKKAEEKYGYHGNHGREA